LAGERGLAASVKILYVSGAQQPDYLCDALFHGMRSHFGTEVVDVGRLSYMYKGAETYLLYGKGFSLYGLIEEGAVDRTDIESKIANRFFDYIVFGSIQREYSLLGRVRSAYEPRKIILIDGEDNPLMYANCMSHGVYFKREMHTPQPNAYPIQFAIPAEKIQPPEKKIRLMAPLDPVDTRTYIYNDEASYYGDYRASMFGKTMKKAGWDCLRHYEIMACYCLPYFVNLEHCPATIMTKLPKEELLVAKTMLEYRNGELFHSSAGEYLWESLMYNAFEKFKQHLTTAALATYVLDTARSVS
jgi:hypothetical protein